MDSGEWIQMNTQLQQIYKTWEDVTRSSVTTLRGAGTCLVSVVTLTTALDPLKHLVLIYIFQMLFPEDGSSVSTISSQQEGEIEDTKKGDGAFCCPHTT